MTRTRKLAALLASAALLAVGAIVPAAQAGSFTSEHKCAPGQHGNPHPAFKPGSCK